MLVWMELNRSFMGIEPDELIVDNFAGGGGTSKGIEAALGRHVDIAINHDPLAISMHAANHPLTKHLCESIWKVDIEKEIAGRKVGLAWFSPDCFPAGTLVLTKTGLIPIEHVRPGDQVMTHKARWCPVTSTLAREADTIEVRGHGHYGLVTTPGHQFYSKTVTKRYPGARPKGSKRVGVARSLIENPTWPEAKSMVGRLWATPRSYPESVIPTCAGAELSEDFFYLVGRWIGDGSINKGDVEICCGLAECEEFSDTASARPLKRADGRELAPRIVDHGSTKLFVWGNQDLAEWLRTNFGDSCETKSIPPWCLSMQASWRISMLRGYVDADGYRGVRSETVSVSKALSIGVRLLAVSLGHAASLYFGAGKPGSIEGRTFIGKDFYRVKWQEDLQRETVMWDSRHMFSPVREIIPSGRQMVHSLEVAEDESYVADGIVVHNCCHFSKAKGGKPVKKEIRGLAWVVLKWAGLVKPRVIVLENVEEFETWGPLVNGLPCKKRRGKTFKRWCAQLRALGYHLEIMKLRACDYGTPTIRNRLFIIGRRDGSPIVWPRPTHAPNGNLFLKPWRSAAECIDWSIPCPSIFERKRPLAEATMRRIARGIERYVINAKRPFIVNMAHGGKLESVDNPVSTIATEKGGCRAVVTPVIARVAHGDVGKDGKKRGRGAIEATEPLPTMLGKGEFALIAPLIERQFGNSAGNSVEAPIGTITAGGAGKTALVVPTLVQCGYGEREGQLPRAPDLGKPLGTIVSTPKHALIAASIMSYYGDKRPTDARGGDLEQPIATVPTENRHALVEAYLAKHYGGQTGVEIEKPLPTTTARGTQTQLVVASMLKQTTNTSPGSPADPLRTIATGNHHGVVTAHLAQHNSERGGGVKAGRSVNDPVSTITSSGGQQQVVVSHMVKLRGTNVGSAMEEPVHTISAGGKHMAQVMAFLIKYFGTNQAPELEGPMHTVTTKHRFGLVIVEGEPYQIVDIGMRMLSPRELFNAQGFPAAYEIKRGRDVRTGRWRALTKTAQIRMCGNSVCPQVAEAVIRAQFGRPEREERCA